MTRSPLAILFALPLTLVGCGDPTNNGDDTVDCGTNCGDDDTNVDPSDFSATLRSVAPYGWSGDHSIEMIEPEEEDILECEASASCEASLLEYGNFRISVQGNTFECVPQVQLVDVNDDGATVTVDEDWLGEGTCGLTPDNNYSGLNVFTDIGDLNGDGNDEVILYLDSWESVVTGNTFSYTDDEYSLSGTIANDLSSITFHLEWGDDQVEDMTIYSE